MNFQKGDIVRLKSGGPTMTIENIQKFATGTVVICTWFDKDNKYFSQAFSPEVIETPPKPGLGIKN